MELETFDLASSLLKKYQASSKDEKSTGEEKTPSKKDLKIAKAIDNLCADFSLTEAQKKSIANTLGKAYKEPVAAAVVFTEGDKLILQGLLANFGIKTELNTSNVPELLTNVSKIKSKIVNTDRKTLLAEAVASLTKEGKEITAEALVEKTGVTLKQAQRYLKALEK